MPFPNTIVVSILGIGALLLVSLALLALGIRGRRTDDHPVCRRCGFDLFGKPPESTRCSECGADLNRRRAVRLGNRARRPLVILLALPLLLAVACSLGTLRWINVHRANVIHHLPVWWLVSELNGSGGPTRDSALAELDRRLQAGELSVAQVARVVGRALAIQADARLSWSPAWGDFLEHAYDRGDLTDALWQQYLQQSVTGGLQVRTRQMLCREELLPMALGLRAVRCGTTYQFKVEGSFVVRLGDQESRKVDLGDPDASWWRRKTRFWAQLDLSAWKELANGRQPVRIIVTAKVTADPVNAPILMGQLQLGGPVFPAPSSPPTPPARHSSTVNVPLTVDLSPVVVVANATGPGISLDTDPGHRATLAATVTAEFHPGAGCVLLDVHIPHAPVNIECDVLLRHGGQESLIGHLGHSWTNDDTESFFVGPTAPLPCDVVLRPKFEGASIRIDTSDIYWGEPIVVKDVRLVNAAQSH
ncbi:MAG: hypothetical protein JWN24_146 [Phycisphaerales bacterium]|nr:hypothetical protein [Phycisphaerales bacterium]